MRRLIEIATQRRVTIVMFTVAIALFGFVSLSRLNLNLLPDISYPTLTIRTELTGAAPVEVENLLTKPIDGITGNIPSLSAYRSRSMPKQCNCVSQRFASGVPVGQWTCLPSLSVPPPPPATTSGRSLYW